VRTDSYPGIFQTEDGLFPFAADATLGREREEDPCFLPFRLLGELIPKNVLFDAAALDGRDVPLNELELHISKSHEINENSPFPSTETCSFLDLFLPLPGYEHSEFQDTV